MWTILGFLHLFFTLLGVFTAYHILRPQRAPADSSNRINAIRLWWFALTREELFVNSFPWLKNDELDNMQKLEEVFAERQARKESNDIT